MKIVVVGFGNIARRHIKNAQAIDPASEVAVWYQHGKFLATADYGIHATAVFHSAEQVLAWQPDAAVVASPATLHVSTAQTLAEAGVHLLVEKPISHTTEGVRALIETCRARGVTLITAYDLRFFEPLRKVKAAIDAGRIGRPMSIRCEVGQYLPDWRNGRDYRTGVSARRVLGGGVVLELSHELDYARWLLGEVAAVSAVTGRLSDLEIDVEDTADILLRFVSGAQGSIHLDMTDRADVRRCRVVGTEGSIQCDIRTGQTDLFYLHEPGDLHWDVLHEGLTVIPDPLLAEMAHFLACCRGEAVPVVDGEQGLAVVRICEAVKRSAAEGREVVIEQR